jgi:hypothetical protein
MKYLVLIVFMSMVGCRPLVPATTPPQLLSTPGAPLQIDEQWVYFETVKIGYPSGWKVVKSNPDSEPLRVVFADEENQFIIQVSLSALPDPTLDANLAYFSDIKQVGEMSLYFQGQSPRASATNFEPIWQTVLDSLAAN